MLFQPINPRTNGALPRAVRSRCSTRVNLHPGFHYTGSGESVGNSSADSFCGGSGRKACQEDPQPGGLLDDLPPRAAGFIDVVEHVRVDAAVAALTGASGIVVALRMRSTDHKPHT